MEREYEVEAFVAHRRVGRCTEYLVHWAGFRLVGEEAAYTWQQAGQLRQDLDRRTYQRLLQGLRQQAAAHQQQAPQPALAEQQQHQYQQAAQQRHSRQRQQAAAVGSSSGQRQRTSTPASGPLA